MLVKNAVEILRHFASDNYAGICPEAWAALAEANQGHAVSYGDDSWTARAADLIREVFETPCEVFFVFNGTAANSLSLASTGQSYHSVLCHEFAHVETDECGAPEFFSNGMKVLQVPGANGKIKITTDYPDAFPVFKFAKSADLRKRLYEQFDNRAYPTNRDLLLRMMQTRYEIATSTRCPNSDASRARSASRKPPKLAPSIPLRSSKRSGRNPGRSV